MIIIDVEQGSDGWLSARLGIPTASQFHRIVTPKTLKPSTQAQGYICELLAEWALGEPLTDFGSDAMMRGTLLESSAVGYYEMMQDVETTEVGFCVTDDGKVGCSPDRLVGDDGGLEAKAPMAKGHMAALLGEPEADYRAQIQGSIWVTGRAWWDLVVWHPFLPSVIVRCEPDPAFQDALTEQLADFLQHLDEGKTRLREEYGVTGTDPAVPLTG